MRNDQTVRSGLPLLGELLFKGQRVDWRYSLVVILVITGMFSTPLALGSIRNRAYTAVKAQIEKENNAREIALQQAQDDAPRLDPARVQEIKTRFPGVEVVGNHKLVVSVEGPSGSDLPTLQTLEPGDPRMAPLGIVPGVPKSFGLTDLVVSDTVGRLLYGEEEWEKRWDARSGAFKGAPLRLSINDLPIEPEFRVVARRTVPGRGVYGSSALGAALRRYSWGFGAPELGLPADEGLLQVALPKLATPRCLAMLDESDPTCDAAGRKRLTQRLSDLHYMLREKPPALLPALPGYAPLGIGLTEVVDEGGKTRVQEIRGDCQEVLSPQLVTNCSSALVFPDLSIDVGLEAPQGVARRVKAVAASPEVRALLPEATQLAERHGLAPSAASGAFDLAVAAGSGLDVGSAVHLQVGKTRVPAQVQSLYQCAGAACPIYADPLSVLRLVNLAEGSVRLQSTEPVVFVPTASGEEYDEILVYPGTVEDVEPVSAALSSLYPGYSVQYNVAAIDKLRRQDTRLATLFTLTIALSAVFLVLALGALARINIERRSRQMAQMLILGFSRRFVRGLVVAEYLLLTVTASVVAVVLTHLLCLAARSLLSSTTTDEGGQDFAVIVNSMSVDPQAFGLVFAVVAFCTWMIALVSARRAAKADPLNLLD
jgi:hypothetical protein